MADSSELGIAFGSAGATTVFMWGATMCRSGFNTRKDFSCSSKALAGLAGRQLVKNNLKYSGLHKISGTVLIVGVATSRDESKTSPRTCKSTICCGSKPIIFEPVELA